MLPGEQAVSHPEPDGPSLAGDEVRFAADLYHGQQGLNGLDPLALLHNDGIA